MKTLGILLIRLYQWTLGPFTGGRCRFYPSCSEYGVKALEQHGFFKGSWLTGKRLIKCGPWHPGGIDEVPD